METRASYIAVGAFVLLLALGLAGFVVWLGAVSVQGDRDRYRIFFSGSVTGLQQGSPVRYRGIPVGTVQRIRINPDDIEEIEVTIGVEPDTPIMTNSVASLEMLGITGGVYVQISGGSREQGEPLEVQEGEPPPVIQSEPSAIQEVMESAPELLERATAVLERAEALLSEENREAVTAILQDTEEMTSALADGDAGLPAMVERVESLAQGLDGLVAEARVDLARISDDLDTLLTTVDDTTRDLSADAEQMANALTATANRVNVLLAQMQPGLVEFSETGLYEFTVMTSELRALAQNLSRLATRFERDPTQFLLGETRRGVSLD
jgi:phospholipid/cholesterol/gamma-HCH transport system substrate-binding protein